MSSIRAISALVAVLFSFNLAADVYVPPDLEDWRQWVLEGNEYRECPYFFNRSVEQRNAHVCAWPGELELTVASAGARFVQPWTVYAEEQWIALPGSIEYWPQQVSVNGQAVEVIVRDNTPSVRLSPGTVEIAGEFEWDERPAVLRVPSQSGLLRLTVDGKIVTRPEINRSGVFLGERQQDSRARDAVRTVVHRLVADDIPTSLLTRFEVDVSGSVREEVLAAVLPPGFVPLSLSSPLPAKLEADGNLHLQVRPGRWTIQLLARGRGVEDQIARPPQGSNMPVDEIWSYRSNNELRVAAVEGLMPVDPVQADVPNEWQSLPAFRLQPGETFTVFERSRGVVAASNELKLRRTLWLDFDGDGFVIKDRLSGTMRTGWRLDMQMPFALLSAREDEENLLITQGAEPGQSGIEVRRSDVYVEALGRADTRKAMPVTGWQSRFDSVEAILNLPPGHKLLLAGGVDQVRDSWMSRWQLFDFFIVLVITIGVWRLFGTAAGVIALGALVLSIHEYSAPTWLWLNLLIAIALLRVAPAGRLRRLLHGYRSISAVALLLVLVPFVAGQLRIAIYPQLEPQYSNYRADQFDLEEGSAALRFEAEQAAKSERRASMSLPAPSADRVMEEVMVTGSQIGRDFSRYAPNAIVQAGPGIPSWEWNSYALSWSGPVDAAQSMRLVVMPRWLVSLLRLLAVGLLLLFAGILAAEIFDRRWTLPGGLARARQQASSLVLLGMLSGLTFMAAEVRADIPDTAILQELEARLLKAPECVPRCAEIVAADVDIDSSEIRMRLSVHALEAVAVPLPGSAGGWRPDAIEQRGASAVRILKTPDEALWMHVEPGRHTIALRGRIPAVDSLEIPFLAPPRVVNVDSDAWLVAGLKDQRLTAGSLQLTRLQSADERENGSTRWESSRFPAFARVERALSLDLDWQVRTTVYRIAPARGAVTLDIPLLPGEQVVSGDFDVTDDRILVSMSPQQHSVSWVSNLPLASQLEFVSADTGSWQEVWRFAVGNIWNVAFEGIPQSNTGARADGVRVAVFHPRSEERLLMTARRPEASAGSTLAFDAVNVTIVDGSSSRNVSLALQYRSTRGSQHVLRLPSGAEISSVSIDGEEQTLRAENNEITVPILPGSHAISVEWRERGGTGWYSKTPEIDLAAPASNIELKVTKARDRWLLATRGPELGPAVLYWSELAALIIFALLLGRVKLTVLKTRHWLLLGLGFSTFSWPALGLVIAWLLLVGVRDKLTRELGWWQYNTMQVTIAGLTVLALLVIVGSLHDGLLGTPDMHIDGNGSYRNVLSWFADSSESLLPVAAVFSVPLWVYKLLILAWALWLSFALLRWLPWVWTAFSKGGLWQSRKLVSRGTGSAEEDR